MICINSDICQKCQLAIVSIVNSVSCQSKPVFTCHSWQKSVSYKFYATWTNNAYVCDVFVILNALYIKKIKKYWNIELENYKAQKCDGFGLASVQYKTQYKYK